jgi:3'-phosphoadenosine 5'-phosphosulfate sulfotransferase (PAPS reductase)/FAD synthetase
LQAALKPIEDLVPQAFEAIRAISAVMRAGHTCAVATSFGKDSSCLMELTLEAARRLKEDGVHAKVISMSGDTLVENPEMAGLMRREIEKVKAYAAEAGLDLEAHIVTPALRDSFQVAVLGGRSLPSFAGSKAECSVSWKIEPMAKLISAVTKRHSKDKEVVILTGTRFSESEARGEKMRRRGESGSTPTRNPQGSLVLSPLADWDTDTVWEVLGYCSSGMVRCYSDHRETLDLYASAGGTTCAVVSDMMTESKRARGGCGARTGCFICTQVSEDKSLVEMVKSDKFSYMGGLGRLRRYIAASAGDWSKRHWVGRPVVDGYVKIAPGTYSGKELLALTRYCLTLDALEEERAHTSGVEPRFQILSFEQMVVLDCLWSMEGLLPSFTAMREWKEIKERRTHKYRIPEVVGMPQKKLPDARYVRISKDRTSDDLGHGAGLEDWLYESLGEVSGSGCMGTTELGSGRLVLDVNTSPSLEVDLESSLFALDYDFDLMMEKHAACSRGASWTGGYRWWLQRGAISVSRGSRGKLDEVLRRTVYKERLGLAGNVDLNRVIAISVSEEERFRHSSQRHSSGQQCLELA